jgi:NTE family protein
MDGGVTRRADKAADAPSEATGAVKTVNLALQGGGSHGAYAWGVLDALAEDRRIAIGAISGASAGAMNAVVYASGLAEGGREGARAKLKQFWLSVSGEGSLAPVERKLLHGWLGAWGHAWPGTRWLGAWADALTQFVSPYAFNPFNINPARQHLAAVVDFDRLRTGDGVKLFVAVTNVRTGRGEIFRRDVLTVDHVMASACLPQLFQAVQIDGEAYWDGGFAGNPPLWPLFYETRCHDVIIVQINPIERAEIPRTPEAISNRVDEITFNASLIAELRAADFVARLIRSGVLDSDDYRLERLHRIGGAGRLESFDAATKFDVSWPFLKELRDLGREDTKAWLGQNFDAIGVEGTLDIDEALQREPAKEPLKGAAAT